jgi:hypothetical protein
MQGKTDDVMTKLEEAQKLGNGEEEKHDIAFLGLQMSRSQF